MGQKFTWIFKASALPKYMFSHYMLNILFTVIMADLKFNRAERREVHIKEKKALEKLRQMYKLEYDEKIEQYIWASNLKWKEEGAHKSNT